MSSVFLEFACMIHNKLVENQSKTGKMKLLRQTFYLSNRMTWVDVIRKDQTHHHLGHGEEHREERLQ